LLGKKKGECFGLLAQGEEEGEILPQCMNAKKKKMHRTLRRGKENGGHFKLSAPLMKRGKRERRVDGPLLKSWERKYLFDQ